MKGIKVFYNINLDLQSVILFWCIFTLLQSYLAQIRLICLNLIGELKKVLELKIPVPHFILLSDFVSNDFST
jgi:hypothetical protein